jgi:hypothetical protein
MAEEAALAEPLARLRTLTNAIGHVEVKLAPFLAQPREAFVAGLTPLDKAKVDVALAYAVSSLFYVLLKVKGGDPANHEVMGEIKRVGLALQKVKAKAAQVAGGGSSGGGGSGVGGGRSNSGGGAGAAPRLRVDAEAGKRVVAHALAGNDALPAREAATELGAAAVGSSSSNSSSSSSSSSGTSSVGDAKRSIEADAPDAEGKQGTRKKKKHGKSASDYM